MDSQIVQMGLDQQTQEDFCHKSILNLKFQLLYEVRQMYHLTNTKFHAGLEPESSRSSPRFCYSNIVILVQMR